MSLPDLRSISTSCQQAASLLRNLSGVALFTCGETRSSSPPLSAALLCLSLGSQQDSSAQALLEAPYIDFSKPLLLPGAISNQTLLKVLKRFDSCYGMSYFQLVQETDIEIKEESDPVLLVFLAEAGSGVPEVRCG